MATQKKTWERWSDEEVSAFWRFTRKASVEAAGTPGTSVRGLRVAVYAVKLFAACQLTKEF